MSQHRALVLTGSVTGVVCRRRWRESQLVILRSEACKSVRGRDSCAREDVTMRPVQRGDEDAMQMHMHLRDCQQHQGNLTAAATQPYPYRPSRPALHKTVCTCRIPSPWVDCSLSVMFTLLS